MQRISEVRFEELKEGMVLKSLIGTYGQILFIDTADDNYVWALWDNKEYSFGGWYGNTCNAEVDVNFIRVKTERVEKAKAALIALLSSGGHSYPLRPNVIS